MATQRQAVWLQNPPLFSPLFSSLWARQLTRQSVGRETRPLLITQPELRSQSPRQAALRNESPAYSHSYQISFPSPVAEREKHTLLTVKGEPLTGNHLLFTEAPRMYRVQFPSLASKTNLLLSAVGEENEALQL